MSNLYLDLLKIPAIHNSENGIMDTAKAFIFIKSHSEIKVNDNDFMYVSAECRTPKEVEEAVDWLIKELKSIKRRSKNFFEKQRLK